ncbi:DUF922 domain-containing protein [Spirulina sp. CCNP1310]|uniref:DUF922 domain-containing protein n=1 Tax=Spirulina sp. CCNP1310 TaxID=3110249 RepID=UPI002B1EB139|nr:DUF922 domain-containing protein [Spirulina sp. CCNP1310]MEA5419791.1 DUF922 domain-containing protein [Spirulina sp. CCNP1310]
MSLEAGLAALEHQQYGRAIATLRQFCHRHPNPQGKEYYKAQIALMQAYQATGQRGLALEACHCLIASPYPRLSHWAQQQRLLLQPRPRHRWAKLLIATVLTGLLLALVALGWHHIAPSPTVLQNPSPPSDAVTAAPEPAEPFGLYLSPAVQDQLIDEHLGDRSPNPPQLTERDTFYQIQGQTAAQLLDEIQYRSPRFDHYSGQTAIATASLKPHWRMEVVQMQQQFCRVATVETHADVEYTYPQWVDYDQANPQLQQRWNQFFNAVVRHEHEHRNILMRALAKVEPAVLALPAQTDCDGVVETANSTIHSIIDASNEEQRRFDETDDHPDYYALRTMMIEELQGQSLY